MDKLSILEKILLIITFICLLAIGYRAQATEYDTNSSELLILQQYLDTEKIDVYKDYSTFYIAYSYKYKQPVYTVSTITPENVYIKNPRTKYCIFKEDITIEKQYRSTLDDYKKSGYDRGHIGSYASLDYKVQGAKESCLLSNMSPQLPKFNRVKWRKIEHQTREFGKLQTIKVITIAFFDNNPWNNEFVSVGQHLQIPDGYAKILIDVNGSILKYWFLEHK